MKDVLLALLEAVVAGVIAALVYVPASDSTKSDEPTGETFA